MDSFEHVVAAILERKGYWTRTCVKVELTSEEKRAISRPSSPRWELDVVGYRGRDNRLLVLECKSYLDSFGVRVGTFQGKHRKNEARYKLFFDDQLRDVVLGRLAKQMVDLEFCRKAPRINFGLVAGKIDGDECWLCDYFRRRKWELWTPQSLRDELKAVSASKYENSIASVVTKLLMRGVADD